MYEPGFTVPEKGSGCQLLSETLIRLPLSPKLVRSAFRRLMIHVLSIFTGLGGGLRQNFLLWKSLTVRRPTALQKVRISPEPPAKAHPAGPALALPYYPGHKSAQCHHDPSSDNLKQLEWHGSGRTWRTTTTSWPSGYAPSLPKPTTWLNASPPKTQTALWPGRSYPPNPPCLRRRGKT